LQRLNFSGPDILEKAAALEGEERVSVMFPFRACGASVAMLWKIQALA
jgi:hypothetical protein